MSLVRRRPPTFRSWILILLITLLLYCLPLAQQPSVGSIRTRISPRFLAALARPCSPFSSPCAPRESGSAGEGNNE
jgi:hypothetical protein